MLPGLHENFRWVIPDMPSLSEEETMEVANVRFAHFLDSLPHETFFDLADIEDCNLFRTVVATWMAKEHLIGWITRS